MKFSDAPKITFFGCINIPVSSVIDFYFFKFSKVQCGGGGFSYTLLKLEVSSVFNTGHWPMEKTRLGEKSVSNWFIKLMIFKTVLTVVKTRLYPHKPRSEGLPNVFHLFFIGFFVYSFDFCCCVDTNVDYLVMLFRFFDILYRMTYRNHSSLTAFSI